MFGMFSECKMNNSQRIRNVLSTVLFLCVQRVQLTDKLTTTQIVLKTAMQAVSAIYDKCPITKGDMVIFEVDPSLWMTYLEKCPLSQTEKFGATTQAMSGHTEQRNIGRPLDGQALATALQEASRDWNQSELPKEPSLNVSRNVSFDFPITETDYKKAEDSAQTMKEVTDSKLPFVNERVFWSCLIAMFARVIVFTGIIAFPLALLFIATYFIHERSKEQKLIANLRKLDRQKYVTQIERNNLQNESETLRKQLISKETNITDMKNSFFDNIEKRLRDLEVSTKKVSCKQLETVDVIQELEKRVSFYSADLKSFKLGVHDLQKENSKVSNKYLEQQETLIVVTDEVVKLQFDIRKFDEQFQENVMQLHESGNQLLLQEDDQSKNKVTEKLSSETALKDLQSVSESKDLVSSNFQNSKEEVENVDKCLSESLQQEEIPDLAELDLDKMKFEYDQAVQLRTEAQLKLRFLTEYYQDKILRLQMKHLSFLETLDEENLSPPESLVHLNEMENESHKYQLEIMKQDMEDKKLNLRIWLVAEEKRAHENWLAARAAERNNEALKEECAQFRQRLTLLGRRQEKWRNSHKNVTVKPRPPKGTSKFILPPMSRDDLLPMCPPSLWLPPFPPPYFWPPPFFDSRMNLSSSQQQNCCAVTDLANTHQETTKTPKGILKKSNDTESRKVKHSRRVRFNLPPNCRTDYMAEGWHGLDPHYCKASETSETSVSTFEYMSSDSIV